MFQNNFENKWSDKFVDFAMNYYNNFNSTPFPNYSNNVINNENTQPSSLIKYLNHNIDQSYFNTNPNLTIDFIKNNPTIPWDWKEISRHSNITIQDITENPDLPWDWKEISFKPTITIDFIKQFSNKPLNFKIISKCKNISMNDIENNLDLPWNWNHVSQNPNLTIYFVEKHLNRSWNWKCVSRIVTMDFIKKHKDIQFNWNSINLVNTTITREDIVNNLDDFPWDFANMPLSKYPPFEFILQHLDKNWDWGRLSSADFVTIKHIIDNPNLPWHYDYMSYNENLTIEFVLNNIDKGWKFYGITQSHLGTIENVLKYPDLNWNISLLSSKSNITMEIIEENMHLNWDFNQIIFNPNVTEKFIEKLINEGIYKIEDLETVCKFATSYEFFKKYIYRVKSKLKYNSLNYFLTMEIIEDLHKRDANLEKINLRYNLFEFSKNNFIGYLQKVEFMMVCDFCYDKWSDVVNPLGEKMKHGKLEMIVVDEYVLNNIYEFL